MPKNEYYVLNNGVQMPKVGLGVFKMDDPQECENIVLYALQHGYRMIDTATAYMNEEAVGKAIAKSGLPREEIFVATKLWVEDAGYENTKKAFYSSLEKLGLDYLDLYLIHQPFGDYYGSWRAMEELYKQGKIKALGVCNFEPDRLVDLAMNVEIKPAVNQFELHPYFQEKDVVEACQEFDILPQAWAPIGKGQQGILEDPVLVEMAQKYNKTVAQIILRWHVEKGVQIIPKTVHESRIVENFDLFDFSLTEEEIKAIDALDCDKRLGINRRTAFAARVMNETKFHQ